MANNGWSAASSDPKELSGYSKGSFEGVASSAAIFPVCSFFLAVHGETGGDGRILEDLSGDARPDIGANLLPTAYDDSCIVDGEWIGLVAGMKLSMSLGSGGDIKLEIGGSRVIVVRSILLDEEE